jgi:hypothetical protein
MFTLDRTNVPLYSTNRAAIAEYLAGTLRVILSPEYPGSVTELLARSRSDTNLPEISLVCQASDYSDPGSEYIQGYYKDGCYICHQWYHQGKDFNWLNSLLPEQLYCAGVGFRECLPGNPFKFSNTPCSPEMLLIAVPEHIHTWMHLFSELHCFRRTDSIFQYLTETESKANLYRQVKQYKIMREIGNDSSRIADLSRLLFIVIDDLFPYFSAETRAALSPLLQYQPDISTAAKLVERELKIQNILKEVDENP